MIGFRAIINRSAMFVLILTMVPSMAFAQSLSQDDASSIYSDTVWYQQSGGAVCNVNVDLNLSGSGNAEKAYNFFIAKGLSPVQSAAILGNFMRESGIVPT